MALIPSFLPQADTINGKINSFFGEDSIDVIRSVDWDTSYLWTVDFFNAVPPYPFEKFFPANDVTIPLAILETESIPFGQTDVQIPVRSKSKELSITFYDDEKRTLLNYFKDWMELDILNGGKYVSGIKDDHYLEEGLNRTVPIDGDIDHPVKPVRGLELNLLNKRRKSIKSYKFGVFPTGQIDFSGNQSSEAQTYTITFVVISEYGVKREGKSSFVDIGKSLLGRFI